MNENDNLRLEKIQEQEVRGVPLAREDAEFLLVLIARKAAKVLSLTVELENYRPQIIVCPVCKSGTSVFLKQRNDAPELFDLTCLGCGSHATIQLYITEEEYSHAPN